MNPKQLTLNPHQIALPSRAGKAWASRAAALLTAALMSFLLAGCGSSDAESEPGQKGLSAKARPLACPTAVGPAIASDLVGAADNDVRHATTSDGSTLLVNDRGPWVLLDASGGATDVYPSGQTWTDVRVAAGESEFIVTGDLESSDDFADPTGATWQVLSSSGKPLWRRTGGTGQFVSAEVIQQTNYKNGEPVPGGFFDVATGNPTAPVEVPAQVEFPTFPDISTSTFVYSDGATVWNNGTPFFEFPKDASGPLINDIWAVWRADDATGQMVIEVRKVSDATQFLIEVGDSGKQVEAICGDLAYATDGGTSIYVLDLTKGADQVGLIESGCAEDVTVSDARPGRLLVSCYNEAGYRLYSGQQL